MPPSCPACGVEHSAGATFCRACGTALSAVAPPPAPGLRWGWVGRGVIIMFGLNFVVGLLIGLVAGATGGEIDLVPLAIAGLACFGLGGYVVARRSPGRTILEPGIAAAIAAAVSVALQGHLNPLAMALGGVLPFLAALAGAWLGERSPES